MPMSISVRNRTYESTNRYHAEEVMFASGRHRGDFEAEMGGWPCTGERGHDCHELFRRQSIGRTITLTITGDHAGYSANHGQASGATGTIVYSDGEIEYR